MAKAFVTFTSYDYDRDCGTAHAFVQTDKNEVKVHEFDFKYSIFEPIDDEKDVKNIIDVLNNIYGNIEIEFVNRDYYHDVDYRHYD